MIEVETNKDPQVTKKRRFITLLKVLLGLFFSFLLLLALLRTPLCQTYIAKTVSKYLSNKTGYKVGLDRVYVDGYKTATFHNFLLLDEKKDTVISVTSAQLRYDLTQFFDDEPPVFERVFLHQPTVNLDWNATTGKMTLTRFFDLLSGHKEKGVAVISREPSVIFKKVTITDGNFGFDDWTREETNDLKHFDHNHFHLNRINIDLESFVIKNDTLDFDIRHLRTQEKDRNYQVYHLGLIFQYSPRHMAFKNIQGEVEKSCLGTDLLFEYDDQFDLKHFNDSVRITANLDQTVVYSEDLEFFAAPLKKYNDVWTVKGDFKGTVKDFTFNNTKAFFGSRSSFNGDIAIKGFPDIDSTHFLLSFDNHQFYSKDLKQYTPANSHEILDSIAYIKGRLLFNGKTNNFVLNGAVRDSKAGGVVYDTKFDLSKERPSYDVVLESESLKVASFLPNQYVRTVNGQLTLKGEGFNANSASLFYKADLNGWENSKKSFTAAKISGLYNKGSFTLDVKSKDPSFNMNAFTIFDKSTAKEVLKIRGEVKRLNLYDLNASKEKTSIAVHDINCDISGDHIDEFEGIGSLKQVNIITDKDSIHIKNISFYSEIEDDYRQLLLNSDLLNVELSGGFSYHSLYKELVLSTNEIKYILKNDTEHLNEIELEKDLYDSLIYNIDFNAQFTDVNGLLRLFNQDIEIAPNAVIYGFYNKSSPRKDLLVQFKADKIRYQDFTFDQAVMKADRYKSKKDSIHHANFKFTSSKQYYKEKPYYENLDLVTDWAGNVMLFDVFLQQYQKPNYIDLKGKSEFHEVYTDIHLDKSQISLLRSAWNLDGDHLIRVNKNEVVFDSLLFFKGDQTITIDGLLSNNRKDSAFFQFSNFEMNNFDAFIPTELDGKLNGTVQFYDVNDLISTKGQVRIDSFEVNNRYLGDLEGDVIWSSASSKLDLDLKVKYSDANSLSLTGFYDIANKRSPLNLKANLNGLKLSFLEAFLEEYVSEVQGEVYGGVKIKGTLDKPLFFGNPKVKRGGLKINYLNTYYDFEHSIVFSHDSVYVSNLELKDPLWNTTGYLSGGITHNLFRDIFVFTQVDLNNTFVLNTKLENNDVYYGQAFATGVVTLNGYVNKLYLRSNALSSASGTKLFLPLNSTAVIDDKDYIYFAKAEVEEDEEAKEVELAKEEEVDDDSFFDVNINFSVNDNAEFEIIFDEKTGDVLKGKGSGNIIMKVNQESDFELFGDFQFKKGTYNFTMTNLINKAFKIEPGSQISWNGNPYNGVLDIDAIYTVNASLLPILNVDSSFYDNNPEVKRRVPVDVKLYLDGKLLNPEIAFDVDIRKYPNLVEVEQAVLDLESRMKYNEQLLNQEVFSLMLLKQLTPVDQIDVNVASGGVNSVSELLSNQFSYWVSQFNEDLEINIDVSGFDKDEANSFSLSMSYSILDGRVRITNEGSFTNVSDGEDINNVFGDWTLEYLITDDGKMRIKAYNRTNQNTVSTSLSNNNSTVYGASLLYTTGFDNFGELFRGNKSKTQVSEFASDSASTSTPVDSTQTKQEEVQEDKPVTEKPQNDSDSEEDLEPNKEKIKEEEEPVENNEVK